jgi:hypothetical protein
MRRYSELIKADVRGRMSPPARQGVAQISKELGDTHRHPVLLEEDLAVAGGSGSGIREGPRNLERCRQIHGGAGERRP